MKYRKHKRILGEHDLYSLTRRAVKKVFYYHYGLQPRQVKTMNLVFEINQNEGSKKKNYCGVNIFGDMKENNDKKETLVQ